MVHSRELDDSDDCGNELGSIGSGEEDSSDEGNFTAQDEEEAKDRGAVDRAAPRDEREEGQDGGAHELPFEALTPKKINQKAAKEAPIKAVPKAAASNQPLIAAPVQELIVPVIGIKEQKHATKVPVAKNRGSPDLQQRDLRTKNPPAPQVNPPAREVQTKVKENKVKENKVKENKVKESKVKETKVKVANGEKNKHATKQGVLTKLKQALEIKKKNKKG